MRRYLAIPVLFLAVIWAGCGSEEATTPIACLEGPAKIETALVTAPDPVRIDGTTPISDCVVKNQPNGDLVNFGSDTVQVATKLGTAAAETGPEAIRSAIQVGYLVGAMEKGAEDTGGIHAALIDRVRSAATYKLDEEGAGSRVHYDAGLEAGRETG
jgi:hypothetical protein